MTKKLQKEKSYEIFFNKLIISSSSGNRFSSNFEKIIFSPIVISKEPTRNSPSLLPTISINGNLFSRD
tara:strand:+ start:2230 stop:2433 length:204 start_codon:yes stop_codon:yes gene_type:complete